MRRVSFRVPARDLEPVLDALLPELPGGVRVTPGEREAEISFVAVDPPPAGRVEALAGGRPVLGWREEPVPADGRERRLGAGVRVGRVVVRPPGSPPPPRGSVDVVVEPSSALFGSGSHPTTRMCLDLLLGLPATGGIADLGCGSGTLAIAAAKLGWAPVVAVDRDPAAVEAARVNAGLNAAGVEALVADLADVEPPWQPTLVLNAAPDVQAHVLGSIPAGVHTAVVSSFVEAEAEAVLDRWSRAGFAERDRRTEDTWVAVTLVRESGRGRSARPAADDGPAVAVPLDGAGDVEPGSHPVRPRDEVLDPANAVEAAPLLRQSATRLPDGGLVFSSARTLEIGARAAVAYLPSLFRFDLTPQHETLGVTLRALVPVPHTWEADAGSYDGFRRRAGEPLLFRGRFELPDGPLGVSVQLVTASDDDQGAAHVIAKATVRPLEPADGAASGDPRRSGTPPG